MASQRPFFLGVGFHKPHLPFYFPAEFGDLYPVENILPPKHPYPPTGMPLVAWHEGNFDNKWDRPCNDTRPFRRAYYSAVSYTDDNIGKLLAELDALNLAQNTVVAVMGDHGWQLGEMNLWRKMTNFELGVRVPLIIRAPWVRSSVGVKSPALVEAVDLFQTFAELSRLGPPPAETQTLQGTSLAPLLADPTNASLHRKFAFSQFAKAMSFSSELGMKVPWDECTKCNKTSVVYMGYSCRSDQFRYTEWFEWNKATLEPRWNQSVATELYNHTGDYGADMDVATPTQNLATYPALAPVLLELRSAMLAHFKNDHLPPDHVLAQLKRDVSRAIQL